MKPAFKIAPSKWEAVDGSTLEAQGEAGVFLQYMRWVLPVCSYGKSSFSFPSRDDLQMGNIWTARGGQEKP